MTTLKSFLNACIDFRSVKVMDFIGDYNTPGADLEEDYGEIFNYTDMRLIPDSVLARKVEYFSMENGEIVVYLEVA